MRADTLAFFQILVGGDIQVLTSKWILCKWNPTVGNLFGLAFVTGVIQVVMCVSSSFLFIAD